MKINIITPCSRPQNLQKIAESINIPRGNYRWIVVFDSDKVDHPNSFDQKILPDQVDYKVDYYLAKKSNSVAGNHQRNIGLDILLKEFSLQNLDDEFIYFNDDDTTIHPNLWNSVKNLSDYDFIHFAQVWKNGELRIPGDLVCVCGIDSHNYLFKASLVGDTRFILDKYEADGIFATEIYQKAQNKIYLPVVLSVYNSLRD